jgi:hypothetical protein
MKYSYLLPVSAYYSALYAENYNTGFGKKNNNHQRMPIFRGSKNIT